MHKFVLSISPDSSKPVCMKCHRPELDHTDKASCEACDYVGACELYSSEPNKVMLLCPSCIEKEEAHRMSPEQQQKRVQAIVANSKTIDSGIQLRTDIFNAQTTSIMELKAAIDADDSITNKHFHLAEVLTDRLNGFKKAVFELNEQMVNKVSEQRAVMTYLNDLANRLKVAEREKIKLADVSYQPNPAKISKPRVASPVKKYDKTEINKHAIALNTWAIENGHSAIPASVLQMVCIARNMTPEQAANQLKQGMMSTKHD